MQKFITTIVLITFVLLLLPKTITNHTVFAKGNGMVVDSLNKKNSGVWEEPNIEQEVSGAEATKIGFLDYVKLIFALVFVISLLYFFLRLLNKRSRLYSNHDLIQNLGGSPLGTNRSIQILKIGGKLYVVGVGENVQLLREIDDETEIHSLLELYNAKMDNMFQANSLLEKAFLLKEKYLEGKKNSIKSDEGFKGIFQKQITEMNNQRSDIFRSLEQKAKDER